MFVQKNSIKSFLTVIFVLAMVMCTMGLALAGIHSGITKDSVKIGMMPDTTGPAAWWGNESLKGARALIPYINDQGGIHGRKLKLLVQDNHYDPVKSISAAKYLITRHDVFCFYNICGSVTVIALFPLIASEKIPVLPMMNQSDKMFTPPKRYIFHAISGVANQAIVAADYIMNDLKAKSPKLAVIYQDDEYGKGGANGFLRAAKHYGLEVVAQERYKRGSLDLTSQVLHLKRANPDFVFITGVATPSILKEAKKLGLKTRFMGETGTIMKTIEVAKEAARGYIAATDRAVPEDLEPGVTKMRKLSQKYVSGAKLSHASIWGYLNTLILVEGLKRAGKDLDREKLVDALETLKSFETNGISGPISYGPVSQGPKSRRGVLQIRLLKADIEKGYFVPVTSWKKPSIE